LIKVVSSIMGSGKTSYAIQMINDNPDKKYIYITPYLNEVQRVKDNCTNFEEPDSNIKTGELKLDSLNRLLSEGKNVVSTHALFKLTTRKTIEALEKHNYTLIMDEVAEVISNEDFRKDDLPTILAAKLAHVDEETGYLIWDLERYDGAYNKIKRLCITKSVIVVNNTALVWVFPATIFKKFKETFILTYMFDCQIQKFYFDLHNITYEYYRVIKNGNNQYQLVELEEGFKDNTSDIKINIYTGKKNDIGTVKVGRDRSSYGYLSSAWYDKATRDQLKRVKDNIYGYFKHDTQTFSELNLWTCFKKNQEQLQGKGYSKGFLSCNARATNLYRDKIAVAYVINKFINPIVINFFKIHGITIDKKQQESYALSELLQFVWRSAIREHKDISLYIPSARMRYALQKFLGREHED